jgi:hypothetical protein
MMLFGISDPWIIGAYLGCFLTTALCCIWAVLRRNGPTEEDGDE